MDSTTVGVTQKDHLASALTDEIIRDAVALLFAPVIVLLVVGVFWTVDWALGPIN